MVIPEVPIKIKKKINKKTAKLTIKKISYKIKKIYDTLISVYKDAE